MRRQERQDYQDGQITNKVKDQRVDEDRIFQNYLINPIKKASHATISRAQVQELKNVYNKLTPSINKMRDQQRTVNKQQSPKMQDQQNLVSFSCKDLNHMLLTVYLMFIRNKQNDCLLQMLKEQLSQLDNKDLKSCLSKLSVVLQSRAQYYLHKKGNLKDRLSLQQKTNPLLMSYIMNSNSLQINSELIFKLMSTLQRKFETSSSQKLSQNLVKTINNSLKHLEIELKSSSIPVSDKREQNKSYFLTFNGLSQEIIAIIPYFYSSQQKYQKQLYKDSTNLHYKLFLFPNYESFTEYLKQKQSSIHTQMNSLDNPECHQKHQYSPTQLMTKQIGKIKNYQQQTQKNQNNKNTNQGNQLVGTNNTNSNINKKGVQTFLRNVFIVVFVIAVLVIVIRNNHTKRLKQVQMFLDEVHGVVGPLGQEIQSQVLKFVQDNLQKVRSLGSKIFSSSQQQW